MDKILVKVLVSLLLVLLAAFSYFIVSELCDNSPLTEYLVSSIDDKTDTVMKLTSASAVASAGVSAIPGDTATPIAEKLADLTGYFLLILSVLYTEKALLTLFGSAVFKLLVPIACGFGLLGFLFWKKGGALAKSVALFALAILITIPASLLISDAVYNSYSSRLETTLSSTEELNEQTAPLAEAEKDMSLIAAVMSRISETAASLSERAAQLLNRYVESVAILVVTSCVLPLLGVIFILWMMKLLFGVDVLSGAERVREAAKSHARSGGAKDSGKDPPDPPAPKAPSDPPAPKEASRSPAPKSPAPKAPAPKAATPNAAPAAPASKPTVSKPSASTPTASKPTASKPTASKPSASKPPVSNPSSPRPAASSPAPAALPAPKDPGKLPPGR